MDLNQLFTRKGQLVTEIELKQSELQQVNSSIVKLLQESNKKVNETVEEPKEE